MATQTTHYNLIKPSSADRVAVGDLNDNSDTIDGYLYIANERADQIADDYNTSSTYNTGDYVRRENYLYKCNTDNTTGTWDSTKWDRVKVMESVETAEDGVDNAFKTINVLGAKNMLAYPYYDTTKSIYGIDFTLNSDGSVTANGRATGNAYFRLHTRSQGEARDFVIPNGKYIANGCPSGGSTSTYYIVYTATKNGVSYEYGNDIGEGLNLTLEGDDFSANEVNLQGVIYIMNGTNVNNLTFHPMIRPISVKDSTYAPYAMTNKELTDVVKCNRLTAGTYTLQATVASNGAVTYEWVSTT